MSISSSNTRPLAMLIAAVTFGLNTSALHGQTVGSTSNNSSASDDVPLRGGGDRNAPGRLGRFG